MVPAHEYILIARLWILLLDFLKGRLQRLREKKLEEFLHGFSSKPGFQVSQGVLQLFSSIGIACKFTNKCHSIELCLNPAKIDYIIIWFYADRSLRHGT